MTRNRRIVVGLVSLTLAAGFGYAVRSARAAGIPASKALSYSGVLQDANGPVSGMHNIQVTLYDAVTAGNQLCQVPSAPFTVTSGRFTVPLPDACTTAVGANANSWIDVVVDGADTGRTPIGAVPYAVEANHAVNATNATNATNAVNATNATTAATANAAGGTLATNVSTLQSSVATLQSDVSTLMARVDLKVFVKGGNNGSVSCDTFCAGSQWGPVGTCVGSDLTGTFIACATNPMISNASVGVCWCSAP
jgi:hypothetical protein